MPSFKSFRWIELLTRIILCLTVIAFIYRASEIMSNVTRENITVKRVYTGDLEKLNITVNKVYTGDLENLNPLGLEVPIPFMKQARNPCFKDKSETVRCLPYFMFLAPQKSGTTDLFRHLIKHKSIIEPESKEPQWFDRRRFLGSERWKNYRFIESNRWTKHKKTVNPITAYLNNFKRIASKVAAWNETGEIPFISGDGSASTMYDQLMWRHLPENYGLPEPRVITAHFIKHIIPYTKFISILRNPTERLVSDYTFYCKIGRRKVSVEEFTTKVYTGLELIKTCLANMSIPNRACLYDMPDVSGFTSWHPDVSWNPVVRIRAGLYSAFFKDWFAVFPRDQFYINTLDNYSNNRVRILNEIYSFLNISPNFENGNHTKKELYQGRKTEMPQQVIRDIDQFYKPYNIELAQLLNNEQYLWDKT